MKTKKKTKQNSLLSIKRSWVAIIIIAVIGTIALVRSFAATSDTSAKCTQQQASTNTKTPSTSTLPVCVPVGSAGGITYWLDNTMPGKRVHITRVNLSNSRLVVRASHVNERGKTPTEFAKATGSKVAINGDFFYKDNNYITNGLAIGNSEQWIFTKDKTTTTFIACTLQRDCFIDDFNRETQVDPKKHINAVSGSEILLTPTFEWTLKPGQPGCGTVEHTCSALHPRTGVALSADRKVMWLVVVEGRQANVSGLSLFDFTQVFKRLGATWAINLDGGGSSGMVVNGKLVNNRPTDDPIERKVGNALGIVELPASK